MDPDFHYRDFQQGRAFPEAFEVFMEKFGHVLEKRQGWVARVLEATEDKDLLTVSSEAFGLLVCHNCRDKWVADYNYKKKHGKKAVVPKFKKEDVSTHAHVNKWSNSNSGSVVGGGWHPDALKKFNALKDHVKAFLEVEKDSGNLKMEYGRNLIMAANDINLNGGKLAGQKRKAPSGDTETNVEVVDITFDDE